MSVRQETFTVTHQFCDQDRCTEQADGPCLKCRKDVCDRHSLKVVYRDRVIFFCLDCQETPIKMIEDVTAFDLAWKNYYDEKAKVTK